MNLNYLKLLFFIIVCTTIKAQNNINQDSLHQKQIFDSYKSEFSRYEKEHGKYIETSNVKMHYLEWGDSKNPTLIWIHGTYSNAYELLEIIDSLVSMKLHVIAIDYYGHGFTPIPAKDVSIYDVADDIKFLMNHLKIKKAIIGGWSRGGTISTAFYNAYPDAVKALILEDGGSVAWDIKVKSEKINEDIKEIKDYFSNKKEQNFSSEFDAYWFMYNYWGIKGKENLKLKKEIFTSYARIKKLGNEYQINPGAEKLTGENDTEQNISIVYTPFAAQSSFGASTHQINPKIIYRNIKIPMLIFDPTSKNDWFDFQKENEELTNLHQPYITHKIYQNTWHGVKDENPEKVVTDIKEFLKKYRLQK